MCLHSIKTLAKSALSDLYNSKELIALKSDHYVAVDGTDYFLWFSVPDILVRYPFRRVCKFIHSLDSLSRSCEPLDKCYSYRYRETDGGKVLSGLDTCTNHLHN